MNRRDFLTLLWSLAVLYSVPSSAADKCYKQTEDVTGVPILLHDGEVVATACEYEGPLATKWCDVNTGERYQKKGAPEVYLEIPNAVYGDEPLATYDIEFRPRENWE
jgi:hypothetical protein